MQNGVKRASLSVMPIGGIPLVQEGDDLGTLIKAALLAAGIALQNRDVLVVTQKIVSKAEGRLVRLSNVQPSDKAIEIANRTKKDPRHVQVILDESKEVVRIGPSVVITEQLLGHVIANAGVDVSNIEHDSTQEDAVLCLPRNPDASARAIAKALQTSFAVDVGVIISDSAGRAWRKGVIGMAIGVSGVPALVDLRGEPDLFGRELRVTEVAVADQIASAANLVIGEASEGTPVALLRGFNYSPVNSSASDLVRPKSEDLFR